MQIQQTSRCSIVLLIFLLLEEANALFGTKVDDFNYREGFWRCISEEEYCLKIFPSIEGLALIRTDSQSFTIELTSEQKEFTQTQQPFQFKGKSEALQKTHIIFSRQEDFNVNSFDIYVVEISQNELAITFSVPNKTLLMSISLKMSSSYFDEVILLLYFTLSIIISIYCFIKILRIDIKPYFNLPDLSTFLFLQIVSFIIPFDSPENTYAIIITVVLSLILYYMRTFLFSLVALKVLEAKNLCQCCTEFCKVYFLIVIGCVLALSFILLFFQFEEIYYFLVMMPLIAQIIKNIINKKKVNFTFRQHFLISQPIIDMVFFLQKQIYCKGYPGDICYLGHNYYISLIYISLIVILLLFVYYQSKLGPQFYKRLWKKKIQPEVLFHLRQDCAICQSQLNVIDLEYDQKYFELEQGLLKEGIIITQCNHKFHYVCLRQWNKQQNNCPICRRQFDN